MKQVVVEKFGGVNQLQIKEVPTPEPPAGRLRVALTSIGMNHAELMARRGEYRLSSGEPPFTPGLEGGGIVDAIGDNINADEWLGKRVILSADAPRRRTADDLGGTYKTHFITTPDKLLPAPPNLPDDELGTLWLPYLTAWGCLVWKQKLRAGQFIAIPAASSSVGLAAAQIARRAGAVTIGMTSSESKAKTLQNLPEVAFDHIVVTHDENRQMRRWHRDLHKITDGHGVDVFFDPVAAGDYLDLEIRSLAQHGTVWVYGLLGKPDRVDVSPLIRKFASIRGWVLGELLMEGGPAIADGYKAILSGIKSGDFKMHIGGRFQLDEVQNAHTEMERGKHIGKLVLLP